MVGVSPLTVLGCSHRRASYLARDQHLLGASAQESKGADQLQWGHPSHGDRSFDRNEQHTVALAYHPANAEYPRRTI